MKIKPSEGNKTFCMAPWTHSYISPQSERRICCASTEPAQTFTQYIDTAEGICSIVIIMPKCRP